MTITESVKYWGDRLDQAAADARFLAVLACRYGDAETERRSREAAKLVDIIMVEYERVALEAAR